MDVRILPLDKTDFRSETWRRLTAELEARLAAARVTNDSPLDPVATARVRGRIGLLKELLALPTKAAPAVDADRDEPSAFDQET